MKRAWRVTGRAFILAVAAPGLAGATGFVESPMVSRAQLVSSLQTARPGQPFWIAIHIALDDGWHTYWRNPGDSGATPVVAWRLPAGVEVESISWPYPSLFREGPLVTYGYSDNAWLFTRVTAPAEESNNGSLRIAADVEWLVCRDICIPQYAELTLSVPLASKEETGSTSPPGFMEALADVPQSSPAAAFYEVDAERFALMMATPVVDVREAWFFPYDYGVIDYAADQEMRNDEQGLHLWTRRATHGGEVPATIAGALVVRDASGHRAFEIIAVPASTKDDRK